MIGPVLGGVDVGLCFLFPPHKFLFDDTAKALSSKLISVQGPVVFLQIPRPGHV